MIDFEVKLAYPQIDPESITYHDGKGLKLNVLYGPRLHTFSGFVTEAFMLNLKDINELVLTATQAAGSFDKGIINGK